MEAGREWKWSVLCDHEQCNHNFYSHPVSSWTAVIPPFILRVILALLSQQEINHRSYGKHRSVPEVMD